MGFSNYSSVLLLLTLKFKFSDAVVLYLLSLKFGLGESLSSLSFDISSNCLEGDYPLDYLEFICLDGDYLDGAYLDGGYLVFCLEAALVGELIPLVFIFAGGREVLRFENLAFPPYIISKTEGLFGNIELARRWLVSPSNVFKTYWF